jgi:hypothetical protein
MFRHFMTVLLFLPLLLAAQYHESPKNDLDYEQAQTYCKSLEGGPWQIPHIKELFSLRKNPAFSRDKSFWADNLVLKEDTTTGTGSEGETLRHKRFGYSFFLQDGDVTISPETKKISVICTDSPKPLPAPEYRLTNDGIVDSDNGILWHHLKQIDRKQRYTFEAAQQFCENLDLHDRMWRLPTLDELYSIVTYERHRPTLDTATFGSMMHRYYWSDDEFNEKQSYVVGFKLGSVATSDKTNRSYLRCVSDLEE